MGFKKAELSLWTFHEMSWTFPLCLSNSWAQLSRAGGLLTWETHLLFPSWALLG